jgi:hypothetical protein
LSFPKIISARTDDAARPEWTWRQWSRIAGSLAVAARLCPTTNAYASHYIRKNTKSGSDADEEAIAAAQGLSDELNEQAEIAASLIGLPHDQVRTELLKAAPPRKDVIKSVVFAGLASAPRTIVVERKSARRAISAADRTDRPACRPDHYHYENKDWATGRR